MVNQNKEIIGILVNNKYLKFSWTRKENDKFVILLKTYRLDNSEIYNLTIFNYQKLYNYINSFIKTHAINNPKLAIILDNKQVIESLNKDTQNNINNNYRATQQTFFVDGQEISYNSAIHHAQLFQYQFLAQAYELNLTCITTPIALLYELYKSFDKKTNTQTTHNNISLKTLKNFLIKSCATMLKSPQTKSEPKKNYDHLIGLGIYHVCQKL